MTLGNFVDGDVPRWDLGDDDPLRVDVSALVVFHPDIKPREFEKSVMRLEDRRLTRLEMVMRHARPTSSHLKVIDAETMAEAATSCEGVHGYDFLDKFIADTQEVAEEEIGHAVAMARRMGVRVVPEHYSTGIVVEPGRSFSDKSEMEKWELGRAAKWRPSVRLQVVLALDGPLSAVEASCEAIRRAVAACGPLAFFEEHARCPGDIIGGVVPLRLAGDEPEVCA